MKQLIKKEVVHGLTVTKTLSCRRPPTIVAVKLSTCLNIDGYFIEKSGSEIVVF